MKIAFTGGGTAGHAMVNKVLISSMLEEQTQIIYIGSYQGAERHLMATLNQIPYYPISTGKLRRYLSRENIKDFFSVWRGIAEAYRILKREEVNAVFSGGGFVSLPVVIAAWLQKIPVLIRETDISIGLTNRICARFAHKIYTTFPDTLQQLQKYPCKHSGLIIRPELLKGIRPDKAEKYLPNILVMGGTLGSSAINHAVWDEAETLAARFQITHLCGKGQKNPNICLLGYTQYEHVSSMAELYSQADVVITRCGSNAISEGLALGKRMVCIPLSKRVSRGEQFANAQYAVQNGCAVILEEENLCAKTLTDAINRVLKQPMDKSCLLTEHELTENCQSLLQDLQVVALKNLERQMVKNFQHDRHINWDQLSSWEVRLYEEIAEEYGC